MDFLDRVELYKIENRLLKAFRKDTSKLRRQVITDKNGHRKTVWVKIDDTPQKKSFSSILKNLLSKFGIGLDRINADYNEVTKTFDIDRATFVQHVDEYLSHKEKYDKLFAKKATDGKKKTKPKKTGSTGKKSGKTSAETSKKIKVKKGTYNRALLKKVYEMYNGVESKAKRKEAARNLTSSRTARLDDGKKTQGVKFLGTVTPEIVKLAKSAGLDIEGYKHKVTDDFARHVIKKHGNEKEEAKRGQIAVTQEDLDNIEAVMNTPDIAVAGVKKNGKDRIVLVKNTVHGSILVEEVLSGRRNKTLNAKTFWILDKTVDEEKIQKILTNTNGYDVSKIKVASLTGTNSVLSSSKDEGGSNSAVKTATSQSDNTTSDNSSITHSSDSVKKDEAEAHKNRSDAMKGNENAKGRKSDDIADFKQGVKVHVLDDDKTGVVAEVYKPYEDKRGFVGSAYVTVQYDDGTRRMSRLENMLILDDKSEAKKQTPKEEPKAKDVCKSFSELASFAKEKYNLNVSVTSNKVEFEKILRSFDVIEDLCRKFKGLAERVQNVVYSEPGRDWSGRYTTEPLSDKRTLYIGNLAEKVGNQEDRPFSRGNTIEAVTRHELGHAITDLILTEHADKFGLKQQKESEKDFFNNSRQKVAIVFRNYYRSFENMQTEFETDGKRKRVWDSWFLSDYVSKGREKIAKTIVDTALKNIGINPKRKKHNDVYWKQEIENPAIAAIADISRYGATDDRECVAEAVADYLTNGEKAQKLSKAIFKVLEDTFNDSGDKKRSVKKSWCWIDKNGKLRMSKSALEAWHKYFK